MSFSELVDNIKDLLLLSGAQTAIDSGTAIAGTFRVPGVVAATTGTIANDLLKTSVEFALRLLLKDLSSEYKS